MESSTPKAHLALLTAPAHLVPCIELANRIATTQNAQLTIFVASFLEMATPDSRIVHSARARNLYDVVHRPPADISALFDPDDKGISSLTTAMLVVKPDFRSAVSALEPAATALIAHIFAAECLDVAEELRIPMYIFVSTHATFLALTLYTPVLDKEVEGEFVDRKEPLVIPGCGSIPPEDLPDPLVFRTKRNYLEFLRVAAQISKADGFLVNSWEELQPAALAALRDQNSIGVIANGPIFPVGPISSDTKPGSKTELFDWLDKQPHDSVLYISFGSIGGLSHEQMTELARGLELSRQRFVWVVRKPTAVSGSGSGPNLQNGNEDVLSYLPEGFTTRTRDVGVVIPQWAPQVEILSHPSVGGFFTHCGWNSAIECITNGLAMIAWPLYAEQKMNAAILSEELGIAFRSKVSPSNGVVRREEIEAMVRRVMAEEEGKNMRTKVQELKISGKKAWSEGGSSWHAMAEFVKHCEKSKYFVK